MNKILKIALSSLLICLLIASFVYLYHESKEKKVLYNTVSPYYSSISEKSVASGRIVPRKKVEIKPRISGIVKEIYVQPGEHVQSGDLIAKIQVIPNMVQLNTAETRFKQAKIHYENAQIEFNRHKELFERKVIPETEFRQYALNHDQANEELYAAESNYQLIKEGISSNHKNQSNTMIRSTSDGVVLDIPVKEGHTVIESNTFNAGTTIATVADLGEMIFEGQIDEIEVGHLHEGLDLILKVGAMDNVPFDGKLTYISPEGRTVKGTVQFDIKADITLRDDYFLRAGYSANAEILIRHKENTLVLDESVIQYEMHGDSAFVEVESGTQTFVRRYIKTGISDGILTEIIQGIGLEDRIKSSAVIN